MTPTSRGSRLASKHTAKSTPRQVAGSGQAIETIKATVRSGTEVAMPTLTASVSASLVARLGEEKWCSITVTIAPAAIQRIFRRAPTLAI